MDADCITMSVSYAVLLDFFPFWKYLCVCVCTLCVAGAHMCKVRQSDGREKAKLLVSCVRFYKIQTTYEKSIRGPRDLLCKWG